MAIHLDINILLNVGLGIVTGVFSLLYWRKVGGWLSIATAAVGLYIAVLQLYIYINPSESVEEVRRLSAFVRPGFTAVLILFAYKAIAGYQRVR